VQEETMQRFVVRQMRQLKIARDELAEAEANGKEMLAQVKQEVEADLRPMREHVSGLEEYLKNFIEEENDGKKIKVPGIGTAFITRRQNVKIEDIEAFARWVKDEYDDVPGIWVTTLHGPTARKLAQRILTEDGQLLPGTELIKSESLTVRPGTAQVKELGADSVG